MVVTAFWTILSSSAGIPIGLFSPSSLSTQIRLTVMQRTDLFAVAGIDYSRFSSRIYGVILCRYLVYSGGLVFA